MNGETEWELCFCRSIVVGVIAALLFISVHLRYFQPTYSICMVESECFSVVIPCMFSLYITCLTGEGSMAKQ